MVVQSHADSSTTQPNSMGGLPLHSVTPQYAIHVPSSTHDAAYLQQLTADASGVFTVDADVDV